MGIIQDKPSILKDEEIETKNVKQLSEITDLDIRAAVKTCISDSRNPTFLPNTSASSYRSPHVNNIITSTLIPNHRH